MKIVIISTFFPPQNSIGSLRPYSWAKYWKKAGHDVTILTTDKIKTDVDLLYDCSAFNIISLPVTIPFARARKDLKSNNVPYKKQSIFYSLRFHIINAIKKLYINFVKKTGCFYTCRYPDWHDGWAKSVIQYLKMHPSLLDAVHFVISTGGPYSVHRVGMYIKIKYPHIKWVMDWRDLWSRNYNFPGFFLFRWYERFLEKRFHNTADLITTVSDGLAEQLELLTLKNVKVIYNGFDADDFTSIGLADPANLAVKKPIVISYTGSLYLNYRDPKPLFLAVKSLYDKNLITPNDIQIIFAGPNCDCSKLVNSMGIDQFYTYRGMLSRDLALILQANSDAVLFLEYSSSYIKGALSGKLFEYLYVAKNIIAIGVGLDQNSDAGKLILEANAGICLGVDTKKIEEYILNDLVNRKINRVKNFDFIQQFSREVQAYKIIQLIKDI